MLFSVNYVTALTCVEGILRGTLYRQLFPSRPERSSFIMRWLKPSLRSSIYGLLGGPAPQSESTLENSTEDIREAMLAVLGEHGTRHFPQVTRRIRYANDVQGLWYLRGDLMAALAAMHGEAEARQQVLKLSRLFQGLLPGSLNSRPSPLVG